MILRDQNETIMRASTRVDTAKENQSLRRWVPNIVGIMKFDFIQWTAFPVGDVATAKLGDFSGSFVSRLERECQIALYALTMIPIKIMPPQNPYMASLQKC